MRLLAIAATVVFLILFVSLSSRTVEAAGGFVLSIEPEELEWGEPVRWSGTYWLEGKVEMSARFLPSRLRPDGAELPRIAPGDYSFDGILLFQNVSGLPEQPTVGWIEFTVRVGEVEMWRSLVVTVDGHRPPDSAYMSGRVRNLPSPQKSFVIAWAPVDDPAAYAFTWTDESGEYRNDYNLEGEWFVWFYDISEQSYAADADLQAVTDYSNQLGKDVTVMRRIFTLGPGQPLEGIDFTLAAGPAPAARPSGSVRRRRKPRPSNPPPRLPLPRPRARTAGWVLSS